jgi:hypothetical protein
VSVVAGFRSASQMLDGVRWMNEEIPEALWLELESQ